MNINAFFALYLKEIKENFLSPLFYIICSLFGLLIGWLFFNYLVAAGELNSSKVYNQVFTPIVGNMNFMFVFFAPLLTMNSFALEKRQNTLGLLFRSPLSLAQIWWAKWLAYLTISSFMILLTLVFPLILSFSGFKEWGILFTSYFGIFLSLGCYMALGLFSSTFAKGPVVSAIVSFSLLMIFMLLVFSAQVSQNLFLGQMFQYLSIPFHFESLARGVIKSYNIIYFISFVMVFFILSYHLLKIQKEKV